MQARLEGLAPCIGKWGSSNIRSGVHESLATEVQGQYLHQVVLDAGLPRLKCEVFRRGKPEASPDRNDRASQNEALRLLC